MQSTDSLTKNWCEGQIGSRPKLAPDTSMWENSGLQTQERDICWWDSRDRPKSSWRAFSELKNKGFYISCAWAHACVHVCVSPCPTWAESWKKHLANRECRWPGYAESTKNSSKFSPQVETAPRGAFILREKLLSSWLSWALEKFARGARKLSPGIPGARPSWKICALFLS